MLKRSSSEFPQSHSCREAIRLPVVIAIDDALEVGALIVPDDVGAVGDDHNRSNQVSVCTISRFRQHGPWCNKLGDWLLIQSDVFFFASFSDQKGVCGLVGLGFKVQPSCVLWCVQEEVVSELRDRWDSHSDRVMVRLVLQSYSKLYRENI